MGMVREIAGKTIMTHYFSTQWEANKYVRTGAGQGWYYQVSTDPNARMHGPFKLLDDVKKDMEK